MSATIGELYGSAMDDRVSLSALIGHGPAQVMLETTFEADDTGLRQPVRWRVVRRQMLEHLAEKIEKSDTGMCGTILADGMRRKAEIIATLPQIFFEAFDRLDFQKMCGPWGGLHL